MSDFAAASALRPAGDGRYAVTLDPGWAILGKPNGGYLMAVLARAAADATGGRTPLAVSGHFLRAPDAGGAEVRTEVARSGRRVATVATSLWQRDRRCLDALVTLGDLPSTGSTPPVWSAGAAPDLARPEECVEGRTDAFPVELLDQVELRLDPTTSPFPTPSGRAEVRGWARLRSTAEDEAIDPVALAVIVDAFPPTVFNLGRLGWAPTVELTVLIRGVPAPGWLRVAINTQQVDGDWYDEQATVWDSTGRLVAQSRQLALTVST